MLHALLLLAIVSQGVAECFYPNGASESSLSPCPVAGGEGVAVCCQNEFECLSNGLCADQRYPDWGRLLRGGCTDKNWGEGCVSFCKDDWPDRDEYVRYCGDGKYCCDGDDCCERRGAETFSLAEPVIVQGTGGTSIPTSSVSSATITQSSTATASSTGSSSNEDSQPTGQSNSTAIGVGVGVGVGVFLIGALGTFIFLRRRKQRRSNPSDAADRSPGSDPVNPSTGHEYEHRSDRPNKSGPDNSVELPAEKVHELPGFTEPKEMGAGEQRQDEESDNVAKTRLG